MTGVFLCEARLDDRCIKKVKKGVKWIFLNDLNRGTGKEKKKKR